VLLTQLRTKDHAVHAGPSQLLVPLKVLTKLLTVNSTNSQNNNSLIAQEVMTKKETKDAMADGWIMPSNMPNKTLLKVNMTTNTLLAMMFAHTIQAKVLSQSTHSLKSQRMTVMLS